jgi:hypothetical protein
MALTFVKKVGGNNQAGTVKPAGKPGTFNFLKRGKTAHQAFVAEEAKAEKAKQEAGKLWRFWMPPDDERTITFLDGELGEDGMLDIPMFYEHQIRLNGQYENFVCVGEQEPCPLCEKGDSRSSLVGVLTVIDHTPHKIKSGPNAGKVIKNTKKLFVCKRQTIKKLSKKATKTNGLAGCTFEVSRTGDKEPSVGSDFELLEQLGAAELMAKYELKPEDLVAANYADEITYRSAAELVELGAGKALGGIGHEKGVDTKQLADEL